MTGAYAMTGEISIYGNFPSLGNRLSQTIGSPFFFSKMRPHSKMHFEKTRDYGMNFSKRLLVLKKRTFTYTVDTGCPRSLEALLFRPCDHCREPNKTDEA